MRKLNALLVTRRDTWFEMVADLVRTYGAVPERTNWMELARIDHVPSLILLDCDPDEDELQAILPTLTTCGLQIVTVLSLSPLYGLAHVHEHLEQLGFSRIIATSRRTYWKALDRHIEAVLSARMLLAVRAAHAFKCYDTTILRVFSAALPLLPDSRTVQSWARSLGLPRHRLYDLLTARSLPPPKEVLESLRLAYAVHEFELAGGTLLRKDLAEIAGYRDADQMREWVRRLTGLSLSDVLALGLDDSFKALSERMAA